MIKNIMLLLLSLMLMAQSSSIVRIDNADRTTIAYLHTQGDDIASSRVYRYCDVVVSHTQGRCFD